MAAGGEIARQHPSTFGQTLGAGWIGSASGLGLLDEIADLFHIGLLIFIQLTRCNCVQAGLRFRQALIDSRCVLLLFVGREDVTEFGRRRGRGRRSRRRWRRQGCRRSRRRTSGFLRGRGRLRHFVHLIRYGILCGCRSWRGAGRLGAWTRRRCSFRGQVASRRWGQRHRHSPGLTCRFPS